MTPTVALQAGGFLALIGFVLGAAGFGQQAVAALVLPGAAAALAALWMRGEAARRLVPVPVPVRARRRRIAR